MGHLRKGSEIGLQRGRSRRTYQQTVTALTSFALTWRVNFLLTLETLVTCRSRALGAVTLVDLRVGVTKLNGNVALKLVLEADGLNLRNGLDNGGFTARVILACLWEERGERGCLTERHVRSCLIITSVNLLSGKIESNR